MTTDLNRAAVAADHLIGNLWFNLDALPLVAGRLEADTMRYVSGSSASMAYSEMCRLMQDPAVRLSAGALESGLRAQGFDFDWLAKLQSRVLPEPIETLYGYVDTLNNAADLLHLQQYCGEAMDSAKADDASAEALTAQLMTKLTQVNRSAAVVEPVATGIARVRERLRKIKAGEMIWGALTGFPTMDRLMRLVDSELLIFAARPSMGKTQLGLQVCVNRAQQILTDGDNGQVAIFSAEMDKDSLLQRAACSLGHVNHERIVTNTAEADEWERVEQALTFLEMLPLVIDDTPGPSIDQVYYRAVMLNAQKPLRLAMSDHTELFTVKKAESETLRVDSITRGFKGIARTLNIPWINLHQLGRQVEDRMDKQPMLSDLKYGGEAHGDKTLFLHRPSYYIARGMTCECDPDDEQGVAIGTLAKNRNGPVGRFRLAFVEKYALFGELERVFLEDRIGAG